MIDGVTSHAFSAMTMDAFPKPPQSFRNEVVEYSRTMFARPRAQVEEEISKWREPIVIEPRRDDRTGYTGESVGAQRAGPSRPPMRQDRPQFTPRPQQQPSRPQALRRDDRRPTQPQQSRPPQAPAQPRPQTPPQQQFASLGNLDQGAVDFRGNKVEEKPKEPVKPIAQGTSVSFMPDSDLKALIAKALGKKS
jgi:hypothetical protein